MKEILMILSGLITICSLTYSCGNKNNEEDFTECTHFDTIIISTQKWSDRNLSIKVFRNGDKIPKANNEREWIEAAQNKKPIWCYYLFDGNNCNNYGILYNYYAITDPRGLAPMGWRIPNINDWQTLISNLGGVVNATEKIKSKSLWKGNGNSSINTVFNGEPAGLIDRDGKFCCRSEIANWWSITMNESDDAWIIAISSDQKEVGIGTAFITSGLSVRCISEDSQNEIIKTVKVGDQIWDQNNLKTKNFRNGDTIFNAKTIEQWIEASDKKIPAWCSYNNDYKNELRDGIFYNWYAITDPRGLAPEGFKIASDEDWIILSNFLGDSKKTGVKLKSITGWLQNGNGNDEFSFRAYPAGGRSYDGVFDGLGWGCGWWTSTSYDSNDSFVWDVRAYDNELHRGVVPKGTGAPVRCISTH